MLEPRVLFHRQTSLVRPQRRTPTSRSQYQVVKSLVCKHFCLDILHLVIVGHDLKCNCSLCWVCGSWPCHSFEDTDGLISQALLVGNFEGAVDLCLNDGRYAEAILLSISGGEELLKKTQQKYLSKQKNSISMVRVCLFVSLWFSCYNHRGEIFQLYLSPTAAYIISGDPELERHRAKLRVGQLEGGSSCSADLRSPWRFCPSVR